MSFLYEGVKVFFSASKTRFWGKVLKSLLELLLQSNKYPIPNYKSL